MKIFVHTGPDFDNCQAAIPLEIDLIENGITTGTRYFFLPFAQRTAGFQNSPRDLSANRRKLAINNTSDQKYIYVVEVSYLLRGKMIAFLARRGNRDLMDIQHLLLTFPNEVRESANDLDQEAVSFFLGTVPAAKRSRWSAVLGR